MRVVALGRTKLLYDSIKYLHSKGIEIILIGTCQEAPEYSVKAEDFKKLANDIGAEFFSDAQLNKLDILKQVKRLKPDIAISVNWLNIITNEFINIFPNGILNCHAGDLPRYRGNAVANWAIINMEKEIVLTIHKMNEELDSGDIILQRKMQVNNGTKIGDVLTFFEKNAHEMFYESIVGLMNGKIVSKPQDKDPCKALRCYPRIPADSFLDWNQNSEYLDRIVRASSEPFSGAYTYFNGNKLVILKSHVEKYLVSSLNIPGQVLWKRKSTGEVGVGTGDGVLVLEKIKTENGEETIPTEIIKSLRARLGMMVEDEIYLLMKKVRELEKLLRQE